MSNRMSVPVHFTGSVVNVGTTPQETTIDTPITSIKPHPIGYIERIQVSLTAGTSTWATIEFYNSVTGDVFSIWPTYALPFDASDVPVSYEAVIGSDLKIKITSDDATNTSRFSIDVVLRAV